MLSLTQQCGAMLLVTLKHQCDSVLTFTNIAVLTCTISAVWPSARSHKCGSVFSCTNTAMWLSAHLHHQPHCCKYANWCGFQHSATTKLPESPLDVAAELPQSPLGVASSTQSCPNHHLEWVLTRSLFSRLWISSALALAVSTSASLFVLCPRGASSGVTALLPSIELYQLRSLFSRLWISSALAMAVSTSASLFVLCPRGASSGATALLPNSELSGRSS